MRAKFALIFFLSGTAALIFEALWFRLAGLSLGNSVWSASLVLAAFMGGLAVGNLIVARRHQAVRRPLRLYAVLEATIGLAGFAVVVLLPLFPGLLGPALANLTDTTVVLNSVRLIIAFAVLMVPAIAMGATLPVLVSALSRQESNFGASVGWLYGWNTFGAMLGVIAAEVLFVPALGMLSTGLVALTLNLVAAFISLRLAEAEEPREAASPAEESPGLAPDSVARRYIAIAFVSGAVMLALEVVWFRFLLLIRDGTSLIFALMLAIVLGGIAAGGLIAGALFEKDERAYRWLPHSAALSAALIVATYWGYDFVSAIRNVQDVSVTFFIGFAMFLMLPVSVLSGVIFTMVNRAVKDTYQSPARTTGTATFFNTTGAMLGSLAAGFVFLPKLGMENTLFLAAATYGGIILLVPGALAANGQTTAMRFGPVAVALVTVAVFPFGLMERTYLNDKVANLPEHTLVSSREGLLQTLRYYRVDQYGEPKYYRLATNGYSMSATSTLAKRYMKLYVYLPIALRPQSKEALLISFGVGSTAKALTDTAGLEHIDVVDISKDILEMSSVVYEERENPLNDERVAVHVEDGRFFLNTTERRYDLITSEPPPPKIAGVVNLYSQEYFELIRERLAPGGYTTYWLPVWQLEASDTLAITRAFCNAFADCSLWNGGGLEWMLVGSNGATVRMDEGRFAAQWQDPVVGPELVSLGIESPEQLGSLFMADADLLRDLTATTRPVKDNFPSRISSDATVNRDFVDLYGFLLDDQLRLERFRDSRFIADVWPEELRAGTEPYFRHEGLITSHFTDGVYGPRPVVFSWQAVEEVLSETELDTLPLWLLGSDQRMQEIVAKRLDEHGYDSELALPLASKFAAEREFETALMYATDHINASGEVSPWASAFYVYLLAKSGRVDDARGALEWLSQLETADFSTFAAWFEDAFDSPDRSAADEVRTSQARLEPSD